ncbi:MAG: tRNA (adenosine(37)-N6)-dimethylallyltransferase MiaA [Lachnospiraceae bacterium]|nr:tRNA (adenosine(37)-N6)-dimethylallyltransferase MiaA [Lachnospiraceae bacterium]
MKKPLIILTGPTAVGKTQLSIALAKAVGGEIISADSMQVYKKMDIGTAKIRPEEMEGVPHYLVDVLDPSDGFDVVRFQEMAKDAMEQIYQKGKIPIIVGGTGFYIQAVLYDIDFTNTCEDFAYRDSLSHYAKEKGEEALHALLKEKDPKAAMEIHPHNVKKVIRALEFYKSSGQCISKHNEERRKKESPYLFCYLVLNQDRDILYERIEKRIDEMLKDGLVEEVKELKEMGCHKDMVSMKGLGYKEILSYLDGEMTFPEAVALLKRDTRHFAKRQLTWFRREKDAVWIDKGSFSTEEEILLSILKLLEEKGIYNPVRGKKIENEE